MKCVYMNMPDRQVELLAPARDLACGLAAINCGADAVYIGAARFGARASAGNPLADVEALVKHAHTYWARVYVTVNTLLRDDKLPEALRLIRRLYEIGADGLIIQDVGLLECDLPPLPLIASTQMHNHTPERVAFLEQVGFQRVILARELDLKQIKAIRRRTNIELECFVHGALCVCYSGQCAMSYAIGGRSGNRGECAQPCRRRYSLLDRSGQMLVRDRYLLSLRDLNLTDQLADLLDAGVTAFKIEGRLKDEAYVMNVVSAYRRRLDELLAPRGWRKSSSGQSRIHFAPDVHKTFNRGFTSYFLRGRAESPGAIDTPKMTGQALGRVVAVDDRSFRLDADVALQPGDGLCFFDADRELRGTTVNAVAGRTVFPDKMEDIAGGRTIYRNHDHKFFSRLSKGRPERRIDVRLRLEETPDGFSLSVTDEDGNTATVLLRAEKIRAQQPERALDNARRQLTRMGDTEFTCAGLEIAWTETYFLPLSALNRLRRQALEALTAGRARNRPALHSRFLESRTGSGDIPFPEQRLTYLGNVLNRKAEAFYRRHGVTHIEPAAESGLDMRGRKVMTTRYCIKHQMGWCQRNRGAPPLQEPLYLLDEDGRRYELRFDCAACQMEIICT